MKRFVKDCLLIAGLGMSVLPVAAHATRGPSRQDLAEAYAHCAGAISLINDLLLSAGLSPVEELPGGVGEPGGSGQCHEYQDQRSCRRAGCSWDYDGDVGYCGEGQRIENDVAAGRALLGVGRLLYRVGESVDAATAAYGSPGYLGLVDQACLSSDQAADGAVDAQHTAAFPVVGAITPFELEPVLDEIRAVSDALGCP